LITPDVVEIFLQRRERSTAFECANEKNAPGFMQSRPTHQIAMTSDRLRQI